MWPACLTRLMVLAALLGSSSAWADNRGVKIEGKDPAQYVSEQVGKAYAVVIGINDYRDKPAIPELRYAVADAKAVGEELKARGFKVISLLDQEATKERILEVLGDELPQKLQSSDRLLIFYAGHGETKTLGAGRTMGYLLPVDAKRNRLHKTAINMGELRQLAGLLPAKHVLYVVDVCYGGIAGQQTRSLPAHSESYLKQITQESGRQLITAGGPGQQVVEGPQWGHSVFTYYLLEGLKKGLADLNHDGVIPASELYAYLDGRVPAASEGQQRPELWALAPEKGEFVFLTAKDSRAARSDVGTASPGPVPTLSQAERELAALQDQERRMEESERQAALQGQIEEKKRQIEEKKRQLEEKKKRIEVAKAQPYDLPRQTGREITGKDGAPMILVPEGEFLYGDDKRRKSLEAFYMDQYEVSTAQYAKFMAAAGAEAPGAWPKSVLVRNGQKPVVGVSWNDATAYCRHYGKRLPTEEEWEKAARGTDGREYPWGNNEPTSRHANFDKCCEFNNYGILVNVGSLDEDKSPYGIYDMAGNVSEWTSSDYYGNGEYKVIRGGSWIDYALDVLRSSNRKSGTPTGGLNTGFRCAQDAS